MNILFIKLRKVYKKNAYNTAIIIFVGKCTMLVFDCSGIILNLKRKMKTKHND